MTNNEQEYQIINVFDYYLKPVLNKISKIPLEYQMIEFYESKIIVLDFCGMTAKLKKIFKNCDIFIIEEVSENLYFEINKLCKDYDVIYIIKYLLQDLSFDLPSIEIICSKNNIYEIGSINCE